MLDDIDNIASYVDAFKLDFLFFISIECVFIPMMFIPRYRFCFPLSRAACRPILFDLNFLNEISYRFSAMIRISIPSVNY